MIMDIKRVPVSIYAEMTPNPKVMKFVSNKLLLQTDSAEFRNIEEAKPSPLATKLFHFPFVKEVFISGNYIAIAKFDVIDTGLEWCRMRRRAFCTGTRTMSLNMVFISTSAPTLGFTRNPT